MHLGFSAFGGTAMKTNSLISALGIPVLGLGALLFGPLLLSPNGPHSGPSALLLESRADTAYLLTPDTRTNGVMATLLRSEHRRVVRVRACVPARPGGVAEAVAGYNLVARECTPAVFAATGLPKQMP